MSAELDELHTFNVTLRLPRAVLSHFDEVQRERRARGIKGQKLADYFTMRLLDYELQEYMRQQKQPEVIRTGRRAERA